MTELTPKQQRFCEEFVRDCNGTQAAIRAGYSKSGASVEAARLLANAKISARVQALRAQISESTAVSAKRVLQELARIGFADPRRLLDGKGNPKPLRELDDDIAAAIQSFEFETVTKPGRGGKQATITRIAKVRLVSKNPALDAIAKHLGMYEAAVVSSDRGSVNLGDAMVVWREILVMGRGRDVAAIDTTATESRD